MTVRRTVANLGKKVGGSVGAGLLALLGSRAGGSFGILMYHRIAPSGTWNVTPGSFRRQLEQFIDRGYRVTSLEHALAETAAGRSLPEKTAVITFDDGYQNVYAHAFPVLRDLGLPATVFLATAYMDSREPFPFDRWSCANWKRSPEECWQPLEWDQCREMAASGLIDIGSHTHTHRDLRGKPEELRADIETSLEQLSRELGERECTFAFPYGSRSQGFADDRMVDAARAAGVRCALTTELELADPGASPFTWGRLSAEDTDTGATLAAKVEGWYGWMSHGREALRRLAPRRVG